MRQMEEKEIEQRVKRIILNTVGDYVGYVRKQVG